MYFYNRSTSEEDWSHFHGSIENQLRRLIKLGMAFIKWRRVEVSAAYGTLAHYLLRTPLGQIPVSFPGGTLPINASIFRFIHPGFGMMRIIQVDGETWLSSHDLKPLAGAVPYPDGWMMGLHLSGQRDIWLPAHETSSALAPTNGGEPWFTWIQAILSGGITAEPLPPNFPDAAILTRPATSSGRDLFSNPGSRETRNDIGQVDPEVMPFQIALAQTGLPGSRVGMLSVRALWTAFQGANIETLEKILASCAQVIPDQDGQVSASALHSLFSISEPFPLWVTRVIRSRQMVEGKDYFLPVIRDKRRRAGTPSAEAGWTKCLTLSVNAAMDVALIAEGEREPGFNLFLEGTEERPEASFHQYVREFMELVEPTQFDLWVFPLMWRHDP